MNNKKVQELVVVFLLGLGGARAYGHGSACVACPTQVSTSCVGLSTIAIPLVIVALTQPVNHLATELYKYLGVATAAHHGHVHFTTKGSLAVVGVAGTVLVGPRLLAALKHYRAKNHTHGASTTT